MATSDPLTCCLPSAKIQSIFSYHVVLCIPCVFAQFGPQAETVLLLILSLRQGHPILLVGPKCLATPLPLPQPVTRGYKVLQLIHLNE